MKKIFLIALFLFSTYSFADEVRVIQNGNKVTVKDGSGTTVVQGADSRTAGQLLGATAKSASELGLGIADAFGGNQRQAPSGRTKIEVKKSLGGEVVENDTIIVDQTRAVAPKEIVVEQAPARGEKLSGVYSVNVAGVDGSASAFENCKDVEIIKDGRIYNESDGQINFTGTVIFTSPRGDRKELTGTINISQE